MKKSIATIFAAIIYMLFQPNAFALTSVGKIVQADGSPQASGPAGNRRLKAGNPIFQGDTLKTGFLGRLHVRFSDNTKLVVGSSSTIKIDKILLDSNKKASSFAIRATVGTFRFISGKSKKSAYKISTRTATIGIRGTGFDFTERNGASVVLYTGSVIVCTGGACKTLNRKCEMVRQKGGGLRKSSTEQLVPNGYRLIFPFIRGESNLRPDFRLKAGTCDGGSGANIGRDGNGGGSSGHGNGGNSGTGSPT